MARTSIPVAALLALLAFGGTGVAQSPPTTLPRVIYGQTEPNVIYGPSSPAPEAPPPRSATPQAATQPPPPPPQLLPSGGTSLSMGWEPAGPPVWFPPPGWNRPPRPPPLRWVGPTAPRIDNSFERPLPQGRYVGTPPGAQRLDGWRR